VHVFKVSSGGNGETGNNASSQVNKGFFDLSPMNLGITTFYFGLCLFKQWNPHFFAVSAMSKHTESRICVIRDFGIYNYLLPTSIDEKLTGHKPIVKLVSSYKQLIQHLRSCSYNAHSC